MARRTVRFARRAALRRRARGGRLNPLALTRSRASRLRDLAFRGAVLAAAAIALSVLAGATYAIARPALGALRPALLFTPTAEAGAAGGLRDQILGTLLLAGTAIAAALPLAFGLGLLRGYYLHRSHARAAARWGHRLDAFAIAANGVPSILFGLFGFLVFSRGLGWGKSWLAGGLVLGLMIAPTAAVAFSERLRALPRERLEAAIALGFSRERTAWRVAVPLALGGLFSGLLLGFARAAGETAPILFCAAVFTGAGLPRGVVESPVVALPYHVFTLAQDTFAPSAETRLWAAALLLVALAAAANAAALPARLRLAREESRE